MGISLNTEFGMKALISAIGLMIAPIIGVFLRLSGANGFLIGAIVSILNIGVLIGIGFYLKNDFIPSEKEEENLGESDKKEKSSK